MNKPDIRKLVNIIHELDRGRHEAVRAALCKLAGINVVTQGAVQAEVAKIGEDIEQRAAAGVGLGALCEHGMPMIAHCTVPARPGVPSRGFLSQPKPQKRVEDPAAIAAYRAEHPICEIVGADCLYRGRNEETGQPIVDVHHIIKRSKGSDGPGSVDSNLLSLCMAHHVGREGWHPLTPKVWFKRFHLRLTPEATAKILKAMGW